ncbi:MAG: flagellar export chaperone FliS, partial [Candidatus Sericytochromatia bacterium]
MLANPYQQYQESTLETASQGKLLLMLYDGAIRFLTQASGAMEAKNWQDSHNFILKAEDVITELMDSGKSSVLEELQEEVPKGLIPLMKLQGLGGKKIAKLYKELGIDSAEALKQACIDHNIQKLPGFGPKSEDKILKELMEFDSKPGRHPIWKTEEAVSAI